MASLPPKRIVILPQSRDGIVAHYTELGKVVGEFLEISGGQIHFRYCGEARRLYVKRPSSLFARPLLYSIAVASFMPTTRTPITRQRGRQWLRK